ncbi:MAG TPA: CSLREA domain-containing protein, partial [Thermoanaerobaculia bacterium]
AIALLALAIAAAPASAAVFLPTKTADTADGSCNADCSLREAVLAANSSDGPDFILLGPGTYTLSRAGAGEDSGGAGDLDILEDLAIISTSAEATIVDGADLDRVLDVHAGAEVEILGVTIRNGSVAGAGGGIRNAGILTLTRVVVTGNTTTQNGNGGGISTGGAGSALTISQSTISGNTSAGAGGGLHVDEQLTLINSTVSGNTAGDLGGGLYFVADTTGVISNVTITGNSAGQRGGGVYVESAPFTASQYPHFQNTILAGNTAAVGTDRDCSGPAVSEGSNLLGVGDACIDFVPAQGDLEGTAAAPLDPRLGPLVNNGGSTPTHALLDNSPAINEGNDCEDADQRGVERPEGAACDIGAVERSSLCVTGGPTLCLNNDRFRITVQWRTRQGQTGSGQAVALTDESGYFYFFDRENVELTFKVLNGCASNNRYWVFLSGLTNVQVTVTVTDTRSGQTRTYTNPLGTAFQPVLDTRAFATCP